MAVGGIIVLSVIFWLLLEYARTRRRKKST
jgi:hypothetical protein